MNKPTNGRVPGGMLLSPAQATQMLDEVVHERVRELVDFCGLLDFEQELWRALHDCGLTRAEVPGISAQLIARAFTRIGDRHVELANEPRPPFPNGPPPPGARGD